MKKCLQCKNEIARTRKFCSPECYHLYARGKKLTGKALKNAKKTVKIALDARKNDPVVRKKWIAKMKKVTKGDKNHRWKKNRQTLVNQDERNSYKYMNWRKKVIVRDKYRCKVNNKDCDESLEVHHIIAWRDNSKIRYKINNGITLCKTHHPRIRKEEKKMIPLFKKLIN